MRTGSAAAPGRAYPEERMMAKKGKPKGGSKPKGGKQKKDQKKKT
jgi:hypothetical protein